MTPSIKRILVASDFSAPSEQALQYAILLASTFGGVLHLVHVLDETQIDRTWTPEWSVPELATVQAAIITEFERKLARSISPATRERIHTYTHVVRGHPADAIVDLARDSRMDLIVMGTHGRSGVAHFLMGSVATRVVRTASCPVLTVREQVVPLEDFGTLAAMALGCGGE